jgi:hypothetical protein
MLKLPGFPFSRWLRFLTITGLLILGLEWPQAAPATGYYPLPRSKAQIENCRRQVFTRYGSQIERMEQHSRGNDTKVQFAVRLPAGGEQLLLCDGGSGRILRAERTPGF